LDRESPFDKSTAPDGTGAAGGTAGTESDDVLIIAASGLFNEAWYIRENPDVAVSGLNALYHYVRFGAAEGRVPFKGFNAERYIANIGGREALTRNPLAHFILHGSTDDLLSKGMLGGFSTAAIRQAMDRLAALPIFSVEDYLALNQDIRPTGGNLDLDPLNHALVNGFPEGRNVFMKTTVARALGAQAAKPFPAAAPASPQKPPTLPPIGVYYNTEGNAFIREIAEDLTRTLQAAGQHASLLTETAPRDPRPPLAIFVAPHEFFHLGAGRDWTREDILGAGFMYTTEQPQTLWFERAMPYVLMSRGIIDIAPQVAGLFHEAGIPALFCNPNIGECTRWLRPEDLAHPLIRVLPRPCQKIDVPMARIAARPIDLCFFGTETEHRERFFTRNAAFLAGYQSFLYYRKVESPLVAAGTHAALSRVAGHVGAHAKITLNIHRDTNGFFEWHRIARLGMVSGSIVVSEPCPPHPVFKPGIHYFEESGRHILNLIEWLLKTPEGAAQAQAVQNNALAVVRDTAAAARNAHTLVGFLQQYGTPA
jgi:hypothetical protein